MSLAFINPSPSLQVLLQASHSEVDAQSGARRKRREGLGQDPGVLSNGMVAGCQAWGTSMLDIGISVGALPATDIGSFVLPGLCLLFSAALRLSKPF